MTAFLVANMAPLMFAALVVFLLLGYPVAFALAANGIFFGLIGIELGLLSPSLFGALPERLWGIMSNDTLLAIPFFTFMGLILERSGMAEDLLDTIGQLFGPIRGGLAYAVIFVGALLAATTGVVAASVISMGLISLPIMLRYGYDRRVAAGTIAASGTLAQIIPPSLVLIIMADQLGRSVGDMYAGAFIPGIVLSGLYAGYIVLLSVVKPAWVPALPPEARTIREDDGSPGTRSLLVLTALAAGAAVAFWHLYLGTRHPGMATDERLVVCMLVGGGIAFAAALVNRWLGLGMLSRLAERVTFVLIPPLALIFLVLGTIFLGVATPTEGGAMGAMGALLMAVMRGRLSWKLMRQGMETTAKLTAFVVFILIGARVFSLTFYGVDGHKWVEHLLTSLPGGEVGFLIVVNILVFLLAFFLDFFELSFIVVPLLGPVAGPALDRGEPALPRGRAGTSGVDPRDAEPCGARAHRAGGRYARRSGIAGARDAGRASRGRSLRRARRRRPRRSRRGRGAAARQSLRAGSPRLVRHGDARARRGPPDCVPHRSPGSRG